MKILSLDQSSKITGWAVFNDGLLKAYGKFELDSVNVEHRLTQFKDEIVRLLDTYKPDKVVFEDIQEQANVQTFKILAMVYGVLAQLLDELRQAHDTMLAVQWKSVLGIKGRARQEQKQNAQKYVREKYSVNAVQDICDAICIGAAYIQKTRCAW